jgi:hypothetical protein
MEVDKDAAARFIKGALAANLAADRKAATEGQDPQGTHTRFEDAALSSATAAATTTTTTITTTSSSSSPSTAATGTGEATETGAKEGGGSPGSQQKKRAMDPFHGYDGNKKSKP